MAPVATTFVALLAATAQLANVVDAKPLLSPGRHASPKLASILSTSKRSLHSLVARYYGYEHGLSKPPALPSKRDTTLPAGWSYQGCVAESWNERLLQGFAFSSASLTPLLCITQCAKQGFKYAGTEYGDECYCGNDYVGTGGAVSDDSACNSPCQGDSSETCGQAWLLSLYTFNATGLPSCDPSTTIPVPVPSTSASASVSASASASASSVAVSASASSSASASASAASPSTTSVTVPEGESLWYSLGCAVDTNNYILTGYSEKNIRTLTIDSCLSMCEDKGFTFGGVEFGEECYCGNSIPTQITYNENQCDKQCTGDSSEICGGGWGLELFELVDASQCEEDGTTNTLTTGGLIATGGSSSTGSFFESSVVVTPTAVKPTTTGRVSSTLIPTTAKTVATTAASVVTISSSASPSVKPSPSASVSQVAAQPSSVPPSSSNDHVVWAHYMVGNTYPYQIADWNTDISKAQSYGIDGFALNLGSESWQLARAADGYQAAKDLGQGFKMFLSLDMTAMSCSSWNDAAQLVSLVRTYATHPNQAMHNGKVLVSTFAGEYCTFGTGSNNGWQVAFVDVLKAQGVNIFFVPSLFSDISTFSSNSWMDGELNWNSAWPMGKDPLTTAGDNSYMNALGSKEYMPAISPFFYTHFGANSWNKNWLYRGDDWLYATRWEQIISMREKVKMMEILTWNDYGESSYIGPIHGALPANSGEWVYGYDHEAINTLTKYYATAFKTGSYPAIEKDQVIMWARPHSRDARASNDDAGQPTGWDRTEDNLYAIILSTQPSMVTLRSGSTSQTFNVGKGLTKLKIPMAPGAIGGEIVRNGQPVASYSSSGFDYTTTPQKYNFNYYLGSSS